MNTFTREQEVFIDNYVKALQENNAIIFAGAGMSVGSGFFDWQRLLKPIADKLDLDIREEFDLTALAQYFVDTHGGSRGQLDQILVDEYGKMDFELTENHRILARLPIQTYWTTNYDKLIERALEENGKTPDVKMSQKDLAVNYPQRDAIVYKMHGDITSVADTVLTKHEYEDYNISRALFSNAFKSDFVAKTFLFIGFSFTDPNLDYLISRVRSTLGKNNRPDYFFVKKDPEVKRQHKQQIRINSLKLYGLNAVWIEDYSDITKILLEIERRHLRRNILICGSSAYRDDNESQSATKFLHHLSMALSKRKYKIISGFGHGVGSAIINGVLENMVQAKNKNLDNYLVLRPFPQFATGDKSLKELWTHFRKQFIPLAGIAIFVFGSKLDKSTGDTVHADGLREEFDIATKAGLKVIPIGATKYLSEDLWQEVSDKFEEFYPDHSELKTLFLSLGTYELTNPMLINKIVEMVDQLNNR